MERKTIETTLTSVLFFVFSTMCLGQKVAKEQVIGDSVLNAITGSGRYRGDSESLERVLLRTAGKLKTRFVIALDEFDGIAASPDPGRKSFRLCLSRARHRRSDS
jgi:hypothetical protein